MSKREKTLNVMKAMLVDFESSIDSYVTGFKADWQGFGNGESLPVEVQQAVETLTKALRDGRSAIEDKVATLLEAHFSEEEMDVIIAFHASPVGQKLKETGLELQTKIAEASNDWQRESVKSIEADLVKLLGVTPDAPQQAQEYVPTEEKLTQEQLQQFANRDMP